LELSLLQLDTRSGACREKEYNYSVSNNR
jgi:hypothetical protein